jgi:4-carboxymuconolactone decarboxylase
MPITSVTDGADEQRYARGLRALEQVSGGSGADVVKSLEQIAPDLGRLIIEFSYGDVISRPGLDCRTKELATVALLTALGTAQPQLKVHISAALNVGGTQETVEAIQQMAVYAGFPAALNGASLLREKCSRNDKHSSPAAACICAASVQTVPKKNRVVGGLLFEEFRQPSCWVLQ